VNTKSVNKEVADVFRFTCRAARLRHYLRNDSFCWKSFCRNPCRLQVLPSRCFLQCERRFWRLRRNTF